jgi:hypothetical protein
VRSVLLSGGTTAPAGTQSAPGGAGLRAGGRGKGKSFGGGVHPDAFYLWVLLALELAATWALRAWSRNHHGG